MTPNKATIENVENNSASTDETVETGNSTKKTSFAGKVPEVTEIGGYVSGTYASSFLTEKAKRNIPVTTVNNLAYSGKIEAVKIAGVFLFKKSGDNSLEGYVPQLEAKNEKEKEKEKQNAIKVQQRKAAELKAKYIDDAIANGRTPDFEAFKKEMGF